MFMFSLSFLDFNFCRLTQYIWWLDLLGATRRSTDLYMMFPVSVHVCRNLPQHVYAGRGEGEGQSDGRFRASFRSIFLQERLRAVGSLHTLQVGAPRQVPEKTKFIIIF